MRHTYYPGDGDPPESCPLNPEDGRHTWWLVATSPDGTRYWTCTRCLAELYRSNAGIQRLYENDAAEE